MKKLLCSLTAMCMAVSLCGCSVDEETSSSKNRAYGIGDTQEISGVEITLTQVESGKYYGGVESKKGKWVLIYFNVVDKNDEYDCFYASDFTLNDTYTIREYSYRKGELGSGLKTLNNGTVYELWCVYDCSYGHEERDMVFTYDEGGLFGGKLNWFI